MRFRKSEEPAKEKLPERIGYSRYYEHDGALRAYANRAMLLAFLCVPSTILALALAIYVRLQPPTVIRVDQNGEASIVGQKQKADISRTSGAMSDGVELERKAVARMFLDRYLNFAPESVNRNWADALNMMTSNLRRSTLNVMEKDDSAGKVQDDQITSVFHLRSIEAAKDDPLTFTAFGVKEVHRVRDHRETTDKLVGEYRLRLVPEKRSEENPSGLLVAEYGEKLIEGEKQEAIAQTASDGTSN